MINTLRHGSWIVTVPLAAAAAAYVWFLFLPGQKAIGEVSEQIKGKEEFVAQAASTATAIQATKLELEKTNVYAAACRRRATDEKALSALYGTIHQLADAAGIRMTRFDPQPGTAFENFRRVTLTMGCSGPFPRVYEFLRKLEETPVTIWVEALKVDSVIEDGKDTNVELSLVIFSGNSANSGYASRSK